MNSLFTRDVTVAVLASGSTGNCTYIGDGYAGVLIDCGPSTKQILKRMAEIGLEDAPIDAVLVTHEHSDHIGSARILCKRLSKEQEREVPVYMSRGTFEGAHENCRPAHARMITAGDAFRVRHLNIEPFTVPHDVLDPIAYRVEVGEVNVAVVTDLGRPTALVARKLSNLDVLVLEYNHDPQMLMNGPYPWHLKQRIKSNHGHLSNEQASELLVRGYSHRLKHLVLAHLSEHNNTPEAALMCARATLARLGADQVEVRVARPDRPLAPVCLPTHAW